MDTAAFIAFMYGRVPPLQVDVTVWDAKTRHSDHVAFTDTQGIVLAAVKREIQGIDGYYGVALTRTGLGSGQKGGKRDVLVLPAYWLDVDIKGPGHAAPNLPTAEEAEDILASCPLEPSLIVDSGGGLHAYWCVEDPWIVSANFEVINAQLKAFQDLFIEYARKKNLHVDQTGNIDRVLRLPGCSNFKTGTARPVKVVLEGVRYKNSDFMAYLSSASAFALTASAAFVAPAAAAVAPNPDMFLGDLTRRMRNVSNAHNRKLMSKILAGESFAKQGERDSALQKVVSVIAFTAPDNSDPVQTAEILRPSIAAMAAESNDPANPALTMVDAVEKMGRALQDAAAARAEKKAAEAKFQPFKAVRDAYTALLAASPKFYTRDGVEDYCKRWNIPSAQEFRRRLIIAHNGAHWLLRDGKYDVPCGKENLPQRVRDTFELWESSPVGEELEIGLWRPATDDKPPQKRTIPDILIMYGLSPLHSKGSMVLDESYYDVATETFWEAFSPLREITPAYNAEIEQWLKLFGGEEHEKLFDWIATLTDLSKPTCALYISGVGSAGKTMLGDGLARLWSQTGATKLSTFLSRFNSSVVECPLLRAAEGLPPGCTSRDIRDVVGSTEFTLERKGLPVTKVAGCLRLIIDDNADGELLPEPEDLGKNANDAVALKFLHVPVGESPKNYLASLGGDAYTRDKEHWVDGDKIAAFALYLRDTRKVTRGSRFLVEGDAKKMTQMITLQNPVVSIVCDWILRVLNLPVPVLLNNKSYKDGVVVGNGTVKVNTSCIWDNWSDVLGGVLSRDVPRKPSSKKIGTALTKIHVREHKVLGSLRLHEIDLDLLFAYNAIADIVDEHVARTRIDTIIIPTLQKNATVIAIQSATGATVVSTQPPEAPAALIPAPRSDT